MEISRKSRQRDAILAELVSRYDHPTAMELYTSVKKQVPNLSLGTLYRNLSQLEENGLVLRIPDGAYDRFDGNIAPHAHFKCSVCGKLYDIHSLNNVNSLLDSFEDENIGKVSSFGLTFFGICKCCEAG